jgi:parallel beta-helix repeat protein
MRRIINILLIFSLISLFMPNTINIVEEVMAEKVLYVGGTGPGNYSFLQMAINDAGSGDTVFVYNGTYHNNLIIDREISLIGENRDTTIINGSRKNNVITVLADNVSISGFNITYGFWYGIIVESNFTRIFNNNIYNNKIYGICLNYSTGYNEISDNKFSGNRMGIRLSHSINNSIMNNDISNGFDYGVTMSDSEYNVIKNNKISGVNVGIHLAGKYNIISENNASYNSEAGIYIGGSNNTVRDNILLENEECGIIVRTASGNLIKSNVISGKYLWGILVEHRSRNNKIFRNIISNNGKDGIYLQDRCTGNILGGNEIFWNFRDGIRMNSSSEKNIVFGNNIFENQVYGISLSSDHNLIFHNNIINNTIQAYKFEGENIWNLSHINGGNYWSDYSGTDQYSGPNQSLLNSDGIGDLPYNLDGIIDHYPLMSPAVVTEIIPNEIKVPLAPQNLRSISGKYYVNLSWEEPLHEIGLNIVEYKIYKGTSSEKVLYLDTIDNIHYYNDTSVKIGRTYFYKMKAINSVGESPFSDLLQVVPITRSSEPSIVRVMVGDDHVNISWYGPENIGGTEILNYTIYRGSTPGKVEFLTTIGNSTNYYDTDVLQGRTYYYRVGAVNEVGESLQSNEVNATVPVTPEDDDFNYLLLSFGILILLAVIIIYIIYKKK